MTTSSNYEYYESKSGTEIQAVFKDTVFGDLHMIKYATQRDVANIHVMGSVDAVSVARGKRATTGACVFAVFEKDRLIEAMRKSGSEIFVSNTEVANYDYSGKKPTGAPLNTNANGAIRPAGSLPASGGQSIFSESNFGGMYAPVLLDQIPPFDITLVGISEATGRGSRMVIHGVQFNSDQGGSSVDDLLLERQVTFLARRISPWTTFAELSAGSGVSKSGTSSNAPLSVGN